MDDGLVSFGSVMKYGLDLAEKKTPKLCHIATARGDSAEITQFFYNASSNEDVKASHLQLFPRPNVKDVRKFILEQDIIWVSGGSVANLLAVWKVHGLDSILREAWEKGVVLGGISAGSICWHSGGTTDSFGADLEPVTNGLGLLPYSNGVHYDSEPKRRPLFQKLIAEGVLPNGYATDDGVGLHYIDNKLHKAISEKENKFAYFVEKVDSTHKETRIETEFIDTT